MTLRALVVVALIGCAPAKGAAPGAVTEAGSPRPLASDALPVAQAPVQAATVPSALSPPVFPFEFSRASDARITSAAIGKPPKVAFLAADSVLVFDGAGLRPLPLEARAPELSVELFFGRDDQPRLMGYRPKAGGPAEPFYRRYKAGRFQPEPSELGPLGAPTGALYGVLGHADPEVVCRPGAFCLVKRTTGWTRAPAHAEPVRVILAGGTAWALHRDRIERLGDAGWTPLRPDRNWREPVALFVDREGAPWIVEGGTNHVVRLHGERWEETAAPVEGARGIWGTTPGDVWLVGAGGAAHFDGAAWSRVPGVSGPLAFVVESAPSLWLSGEAGVFRGTRTSSP